MDDDFDFDRAASAFPDIDLDGHGDVPLPSAPAASSGFSFDDFGSPLGQTEVKVTGDDEIEKFEDQFPELNVGQVSSIRLWVTALYQGACLLHSLYPLPHMPYQLLVLLLHLLLAHSHQHFRRRPSSTSNSMKMSLKLSGTSLNYYIRRSPLTVVNQRKWRESQVEEIQARDEASKAKRQQTIGKAEHAIDQFYEEYAAKKERTIRENKSVKPGPTRRG
jgi:hypothetical protein